MGTQIPDLPQGQALDGDELTPVRDAGGDTKVSIDQIADYVINRLTSVEALDKVKSANPQVNGLNANLLQGLLASHFLNASNLNNGTVPDARLPSGESNDSWQAGGGYFSAGTYRGYWKVPESTFPGKWMIQFGWSNFVGHNVREDVNFATPFSSGFTAENKPLVILTSESRRTGWVNSANYVAGGDSATEVELVAQLWYADLNKFRFGTIRHYGSGPDYVRANYIAIGHYA